MFCQLSFAFLIWNVRREKIYVFILIWYRWFYYKIRTNMQSRFDMEECLTRRRFSIVSEIISSEKIYLKHLDILIQVLSCLKLYFSFSFLQFLSHMFSCLSNLCLLHLRSWFLLPKLGWFSGKFARFVSSIRFNNLFIILHIFYSFLSMKICVLRAYTNYFLLIRFYLDSRSCVEISKLSRKLFLFFKLKFVLINCQCHLKFFQVLFDHLSGGDVTGAFATLTPYLKLYGSYARNFPNSQHTLQVITYTVNTTISPPSCC